MPKQLNAIFLCVFRINKENFGRKYSHVFLLHAWMQSIDFLHCFFFLLLKDSHFMQVLGDNIQAVSNDL